MSTQKREEKSLHLQHIKEKARESSAFQWETTGKTLFLGTLHMNNSEPPVTEDVVLAGDSNSCFQHQLPSICWPEVTFSITLHM